MSWVEIKERRTAFGRHYMRGLQRRFETVLKTKIHYENGAGLETVDFRPIKITNAEFDGWTVQKNDWHYALGEIAAKGSDGWVGFGGKHGANYIWSRLVSAGHLHWPTKNYTPLATATYNRANLALSNEPLLLADGEDPIYAGARVEWENVFPGVDLRWDADGIRLKEEIVVSDAARAVWQDPATPDEETFAGFVFEIDDSEIPLWTVDGLPHDPNDGFDDENGLIEARDDLQELIAFMPLDYVFAAGAGPDDPRIRVRKRIWEQAGKRYLLIGIKVSEMKSIPAGTIIFDPTFETQPGSASGKACSIRGDNADFNYGNSIIDYIHATIPRNGLMEFDCSSLSNSFTCDNATLYLTSVSSYPWDTNETITVYSLHENVADWVENECTFNIYKSGSNWPGSAGAGTAGVDYESGAMGSALGPGGSGVGSISLSASRVTGWFGVDNTNYGMKLVLSTNWAGYYSDDFTTSSYRPKLIINYTEGPADPAGAGSVSDGWDQAKIAGAEAAIGSVLVASQPPITLNTRGNLFWNTSGPQLSIMLFVCDGSDWVQMDGQGTPQPSTHGFSVERIKAYLVPQ